MTQIKSTQVKILFRFFSNVLDEWTVETMWAETMDAGRGLYKLDSIPFYAPVASGDIVFAEYDETEEELTYRHTIEYSGNSTIQVVVLDKTKEVNIIRDIFSELTCISEKLNERYFTMDVPANIDYDPIRQRLIELEAAGTIGYAEPSLSQNHWYD